MKNSKFYLRFSFLMLFCFFLSLGLFAQHGRGHYGNSRSYGNSYSYGNSNRHNNYSPRSYSSRPQVSVNIGPRYVPRYNYRPYYRPRPVYRSPYAYSHFGPAFGVRINLLPVGYSRIYVGPNPYYYNQGVYYRPYSNGGYEVIAPPLGAVVSRLPAGAKVTVIDGQKYYQLGGTFYQEEVTDNNSVVYRVTGTDGVINTLNEGEDTVAEGEDEPEVLNNQEPEVLNNKEPEVLNNKDEVLPAIGSRYDVLPRDCTVEVINQHKYFVSGKGVYYQEVIEGNKIRYEVTTVE